MPPSPVQPSREPDPIHEGARLSYKPCSSSQLQGLQLHLELTAYILKMLRVDQRPMGSPPKPMIPPNRMDLLDKEVFEDAQNNQFSSIHLDTSYDLFSFPSAPESQIAEKDANDVPNKHFLPPFGHLGGPWRMPWNPTDVGD